MKLVELFFNRLYFGLYYPLHFLDQIAYGDSFVKVAMIVRRLFHMHIDEKEIKSTKQLPKQISNFCSMQIVNLIVGFTMYLPATLLLHKIIFPAKPNLLSFVSLWGGLFVLYLYLTYILYSKNEKKIKYIAKFLKEPSRKKWIWSIISLAIIIAVWWATIIIYRII